jgi:hypothetical protein
VGGGDGMSDSERIDAIEAKVDLVLDKMTNVETMVAKVIAEVKPTIDELMNSSLFKMLGMKKK